MPGRGSGPARGSIVVADRFRGPPNSGNGGYVCGRLAAYLDGPAEVTLRRPPPLDVALAVADGGEGTLSLLHGDVLVASAAPTTIALEPPHRPSFAEAVAAAERAVAPAEHLLPMCFVCGPGRADGDGLRIFTGPLGDDGAAGLMAAPWVPGDDLAGPDGRVAAEFVWSALDCPTGFATATAGRPETILLGRLAARIERRPLPGEACVVLAWPVGRAGRKLRADGVLLAGDGEVLARAQATWIAVDLAVMQGRRR